MSPFKMRGSPMKRNFKQKEDDISSISHELKVGSNNPPSGPRVDLAVTPKRKTKKKSKINIAYSTLKK
tara:strand:- start:14 stop:217 length:204 start_codon:yes stop_codon:yes gene_type:complete